MKNKSIIVLLCAVLVLALSLTAFGLSGLNGKNADKAQQPYKSLIENRMNFTVDKTDFSFSKTSEDDIFCLSFTVTAAKTEADFYAMLNGITLTGGVFESVIYEPGENNGEYNNPHSLIMPIGDNGKPLTLSWKVTATFRYSSTLSKSFAPELQINYTSGLKIGYADSHILTVPINITVSGA